jgi:hypothetical protein
MHVKMTLTFPNETIETLRAKATAEGFLSPNILARYLIMRGLKNGMDAEIREDDSKRTYTLEVEDAGEIENYCKAKRLGSVPDFALFAMEQSMMRHPLSASQKARVGERVGKDGVGA